MKTKRKSFDQFLWHDIDFEDDAAKQEEYLESALPLIGQIVMYFNALEKELDKVIYEGFSDRSDQLGIIIVHNMNYAAKSSYLDVTPNYSIWVLGSMLICLKVL